MGWVKKSPQPDPCTPLNVTWKRIQCTPNSKTNPSHQRSYDAKRAQLGVNICDEERSKMQKEEKNGRKRKKKISTTEWWRLLGSLAENNETHELELLGALEPTCSRCTLTLIVGKSSQNFVSNGNKMIFRRDEADSS